MTIRVDGPFIPYNKTNRPLPDVDHISTETCGYCKTVFDLRWSLDTGMPHCWRNERETLGCPGCSKNWDSSEELDKIRAADTADFNTWLSQTGYKEEDREYGQLELWWEWRLRKAMEETMAGMEQERLAALITQKS